MADGSDRALAEEIAADILKEDAAGAGANQEAVALLAQQEAAAQEAAAAEAAAEAERTAAAAAEGTAAETEAEKAAAAEALAKAAAEAETGKKKKAIQPLEPWVKDRLAEKTAKQREAERLAQEADARAQVAVAEAEELRRRIAALEAGDTPASPAATSGDPKNPPAGFVPEAEVDRRAALKAANDAHNAQANAAYQAGLASYEDFDKAVERLQEMELVGRRDFQEAALVTGSAADVIYHLGSNDKEANNILGLLNGGRNAEAVAELTKISVKLEGEKTRAKAAAAKNVSQAPAPIRAVGGSALPALDLDKADDDTFTDELNKKARANGWW